MYTRHFGTSARLLYLTICVLARKMILANLTMDPNSAQLKLVSRIPGVGARSRGCAGFTPSSFGRVTG
jgi:hypothetical protein